MTPIFRKHGSIIISLIGALGIIITAWWANGTEYNDTAWLYAFCIWLILYSAFEVYSNIRKNKDQ